MNHRLPPTVSLLRRHENLVELASSLEKQLQPYVGKILWYCRVGRNPGGAARQFQPVMIYEVASGVFSNFEDERAKFDIDSQPFVRVRFLLDDESKEITVKNVHEFFGYFRLDEPGTSETSG